MIRLDAELLKKTGIFALVSGELIACIGCGYWLGSFLDERWKTEPVFTAVLSTLGLAYAIWRIYGVMKKSVKGPGE